MNNSNNQSSVTVSAGVLKKIILPSVALILTAVCIALVILLCLTGAHTAIPFPGITQTPEEGYPSIPPLTPIIPITSITTITPITPIKPTDSETQEPETNLFDGYFEKGTIGSDGREADSDEMMRSGYIKVSPGEMYTLSIAFPGYPCSYSNLVEYDADKNLVRYCVYGDTMGPRTFITSANTEYIRIFTSKSEFSTPEYLEMMDYRLVKGRGDSLVQRFENGLTHDSPSNPGINNMLARLSVFCDNVLTASGEGMTIGFIDKNKIGQADPYSRYKLSENESIIGFPYSSVRKTNTYIGIDVGVYTFFSAIKNPASVVYTSDYRDPLDPGYSSWIYYAWNPYGAVCSSMIDYAYGLDFVYTTYEWETIDGMEKLDMSENEIRIGDVLCNVTQKDFSGGHMAIVTDILRDSDNKIKYVQISEAAIPCMTRTYVTYDYFKSHFLDIYSVYRYAYPERIPSPDISLSFDKMSYNNSLALDKGDMSVYKENEIAQINILDKSAEYLVILCDKTECARIRISETGTKTINGKKYKIYGFTHTKTGKYSAYLEYKDEKKSDSIQWEYASAGDAAVSKAKATVGESFVLSFGNYSNCKPIGVCLETSTYVTRYQRRLTDDEISNGKVTLSYEYPGSYTVRIVYETQFGRIYSERKAIQIS